MKTRYLLLWVAGGLVLTMPEIGAQTKTEPQPNKKYNVHREYDQNGNLSRYDSSVVSTWGSGNNSVTSEFQYSESHSFDNMDSLFGDFGMDPFSFNDSILSEMMNHFGFNFSDAPSDSEMFGQFPSVPFMAQPGRNPGMDENIARQMEEMERQMQSMMQQHKEMFKNQNKPVLTVPDAPPSPNKQDQKAQQQSAPAEPQSQDPNIFNI